MTTKEVKKRKKLNNDNNSNNNNALKSKTKQNYCNRNSECGEIVSHTHTHGKKFDDGTIDKNYINQKFVRSAHTFMLILTYACAHTILLHSNRPIGWCCCLCDVLSFDSIWFQKLILHQRHHHTTTTKTITITIRKKKLVYKHGNRLKIHMWQISYLCIECN